MFGVVGTQGHARGSARGHARDGTAGTGGTAGGAHNKAVQD
jgi:hypothetical protein